jgi:hypothetical protein
MTAILGKFTAPGTGRRTWKSMPRLVHPKVLCMHAAAAAGRWGPQALRAACLALPDGKVDARDGLMLSL